MIDEEMQSGSVFYIVSAMLQKHKEEITLHVSKLRAAANSIEWMVDNYGYAPEVDDVEIIEGGSLTYFSTAEDTGLFRFVVLEHFNSGALSLHTTDNSGDVGTEIADIDDFIAYLTGGSMVAENEENEF